MNKFRCLVVYCMTGCMFSVAKAAEDIDANGPAKYEFSGHFYGNTSNGSLVASYLFADVGLTRITSRHLTKLRFSTINASIPTVVTVNGEDPATEDGMDTVETDPREFISNQDILGNRLVSLSHQIWPKKVISPVFKIRVSENPQIKLEKNDIVVARAMFKQLKVFAERVGVEDDISTYFGAGYFTNEQRDEVSSHVIEDEGLFLNFGFSYIANIWSTTIHIGYDHEYSADYERSELRLGLDFWFDENVAISINNRTLRFIDGFVLPKNVAGKSDSNGSVGVIFRRNF